MRFAVDTYHYGIEPRDLDGGIPAGSSPGAYAEMAGMISERGLAHTVDCAIAYKEGLGSEISMALDCGPGWKVPGAVAFARKVEHLQPIWLEDLAAGNYSPFPGADLYHAIKRQTAVPLMTGEQIYLRNNFKDLIETRAVDVVGPDPMDVGGIAELKWIAEYAHIHDILVAPHGILNGPFGLAALVQVCATLPDNYVAFELPMVPPAWKGLISGIEEDMIQNGCIRVGDAPGLGIDLVEDEVRRLLGKDDMYLPESLALSV
ncbi:MAG: D-galactonate dehydratase [candidate division BRC1 bacterium ADurb.BinA364]|nr:MAG: D-galactonate dehydratase [candidate division BRC1 bacterium ADurb.BinA364]